MASPTTFMEWVVFLLHKYLSFFLQGCEITLVLALVGTLLGCVIGLLVGVLRTVPAPGPKANPAIKALYRLMQ